MILERLRIRNHFRVIVGGEDVRAGKPDPEPYLRAAELLGIPPPRCLAVEDSGVGVRAAKAAGMFCIAVRNPGARTLQLLSDADLELASLRDIPLESLR
jgi:beta-phosphoglucomutase-like phosphatase (HAD superfamily)